ncbi:hypothetical protein N7486_011168 [Penicillium sp. IBT 16267x]|nr:hypothetical protein N7486_011168 [Penicillium sp. IBT 16267x]
MASPTPWFHHGKMARIFKPGETITLPRPEISEWKLDEVISEFEQQLEKASTTEKVVSYASIKFACHKLTDPKTIGMMRIYVQIPNSEIDREKSETQAKEAMPDFVHKELQAYMMLSEHPNAARFTPRLLGWRKTTQFKEEDWPVPGGFLTALVWEVVPGQQRNLIRNQFKESFIALDSIGIRLKPSHPSKLVWNKKKQRLYWVGFADWNPATHDPWTDNWYSICRLVQVPWDDQARLYEWDGSTETWSW